MVFFANTKTTATIFPKLGWEILQLCQFSILVVTADIDSLYFWCIVMKMSFVFKWSLLPIAPTLRKKLPWLWVFWVVLRFRPVCMTTGQLSRSTESVSFSCEALSPTDLPLRKVPPCTRQTQEIKEQKIGTVVMYTVI